MSSRSKQPSESSRESSWSPRVAVVALAAWGAFAFAAPAAAQQATTAAQQATVQQMQAAGAGAQMDVEAREHFRVAQPLYESGRFAEAAREFEAAYQLSHRPELLFNVYVANRDANDLDKAVPALRAYLAAMPTTLPGRVNLEARLSAMDATLAERASAAQASAEQAAAVAAAQQRAADAEAAQHQAERVARARPSAGFQVSIPGVVVGGVGVAAALSGFVVGALALGKVSDLESVCPANVCPASARGTYDSAQTLVTASDVLIIGGAVLAVGGLAMVLLGVGAPSDDGAGASAMASCGPTGCLAGVSGRF